MIRVSFLILLVVVEAVQDSLDTVPAAAECEFSLIQTELRLTKGKDRMKKAKAHSASVQALEGVRPEHRESIKKDSVVAANGSASTLTVDAAGGVAAAGASAVPAAPMKLHGGNSVLDAGHKAWSSSTARTLAWLQIELRESNLSVWIMLLGGVGICLIMMFAMGMNGQEPADKDDRLAGAYGTGANDTKMSLNSALTTPGGRSRLPTQQSLAQQRSPLVSSAVLPPGASMMQNLQPKPGDVSVLPPICPSLILPHTEARFMIQMEQLQRAATGPLNILGSSGRKLLHALVCDTPDSRRCLMLASCGCEDDPRTCIFTPQPGSMDSQALEVFGKAGKFYGWLEFPSPNQGLLLYSGNGGEPSPVLRIEMGSPSDLRMSASLMDGKLLASAGRSAAGGAEGADTWKMQVKPGTDAVLITSCMLALILLRPWPSGDPRISVGASTMGGTAASLRQYPSATTPSGLSSFFKP